jgi:uncharacterized protein YqgV (UPF0045/DUF77 family)
MIDRRDLNQRLTPIRTIIETADIDEALKVVADAYRELDPDCGRVYATVKLDIRKGRGGRISGKIESVERKLGKTPRT